MGAILEEGVRHGHLSKESGSSSGTKKYGNSLQKKKEGDTNSIFQGERKRNPINESNHQNQSKQQYYQQPHFFVVTLVVCQTHVIQTYQL